MNGRTTQLLAQRNFAGLSIDLYLFERFEGRTATVKNIEMQTLEPNVAADPLFRLSDSEAQELMDSLYSAGFRPTEGKDNAGQLSATQAHLQDMRAIAFNFKLQSKP